MACRALFQSPVLAAWLFLGASSADGQITLERTSCFGFCPAYRLVIQRNGDVSFSGRNRWAVDTGHSQLRAAVVDSVSTWIAQAGFFALDSVYDVGTPGCGSWHTDAPYLTLTVVDGWREKSVRFYLGCQGERSSSAPSNSALRDPRNPRARIERLADAVDSLAGVAAWIKEPSRRTRVLLATHDRCFEYGTDTVQLTGTLRRHTFPGPPNYESVSAGDKPETGFYLHLERPICTIGNADSSDEYPVPAADTVQLVLDSAWYSRLRPSLGKKTTLSGTLFARFTGHHHAPLLLQVLSSP